MTTLITGGTGVLGSCVARRLVADGEHVLVLGTSGDTRLVSDLDGRVDLRRCDVRDRPAMERLIADESVDCVIHMAAMLHVASAADPAGAVDVNVGATAALYEACARLGVRRLVQASSKSVYGRLPQRHRAPAFEPIDENTAARPATVYDATKYAAELVLAAQSREDGPEVASLRFATIYGPGKQLRHGPTAVLSVIVEGAIRGEPVRVPRGGDQVDDIIYVEDAAEGVVCAARARSRRHTVYNIGTGVGTRIADFAARVRAVLGPADIEIGPGLGYMGDDPVYGVLDVGRAREDLGFSCEPDVDGALIRYAALMERLALGSRAHR